MLSPQLAFFRDQLAFRGLCLRVRPLPQSLDPLTDTVEDVIQRTCFDPERELVPRH